MKAITLWRPWDQAILYGGKNWENRPWALWANMIGQPIALHAGKKYDHDGAEWMRTSGLYTPPAPEDCPTGIVGVVIFDRVVGPLQGRRMAGELSCSWLFGPFGWHVDEVHSFSSPITCRGKQGLWNSTAEADELWRKIQATKTLNEYRADGTNA